MYDKFSNRNFGAKICRFDCRLELTREENVAQEFEVRSKSYDRAKRNKALVRRAIFTSNIAIKRYFFSACELKISIYGYIS